ncbi:hypothetical protein JKP88DRAFT_353504 [Tribonema minus]|uniref:Uncharacterized protein n=1 Tax=Tribonema minus TaxID=303371 RepID=A0A835Z946_9STRA|nr:hypothetical protein JKP88DRAFT_353504 [Tribonema minus]
MERGRVSAACTLVLTGRLSVAAGRDEFPSDAGPWSVLAADALLSPEGHYKPDFSARVASDALRIVRMSRATFEVVKEAPVTPPATSPREADAVAVGRGDGGGSTAGGERGGSGGVGGGGAWGVGGGGSESEVRIGEEADERVDEQGEEQVEEEGEERRSTRRAQMKKPLLPR